MRHIIIVLGSKDLGVDLGLGLDGHGLGLDTSGLDSISVERRSSVCLHRIVVVVVSAADCHVLRR